MKLSLSASTDFLHDRLRAPPLTPEHQFYQRVVQHLGESEVWKGSKPFRFEFPFLGYQTSAFSLPHPLREGVLTVGRRADFYTAELTMVAMHANFFTNFSPALARSFGKLWHPTHPDGRGYIFHHPQEPLASIGLPSLPLRESCNSHRIITLGTAGAVPRHFTADKGAFMSSLRELEDYGNRFLDAFYHHHGLSPLAVTIHAGC